MHSTIPEAKEWIPDTDPTPVLMHWQGLVPDQELSEADLESYAENFYQHAPLHFDELWCNKGPFT